MGDCGIAAENRACVRVKRDHVQFLKNCEQVSLHVIVVARPEIPTYQWIASGCHIPMISRPCLWMLRLGQMTSCRSHRAKKMEPQAVSQHDRAMKFLEFHFSG